jgi:hypothetical protein
VTAGSRSFAAIGQWAADAGPAALAVLGAARGPRRSPPSGARSPLVSADVLDRVLGAWLWIRAVQAGGRLVIAIDGKTVRGVRNKTGKAPHLVAALAHGIGAVLGQVSLEAYGPVPSPKPAGGRYCPRRGSLNSGLPRPHAKARVLAQSASGLHPALRLKPRRRDSRALNGAWTVLNGSG